MDGLLGDLLCACIGSDQRAEYTLFGNSINLSARLMCKAKNGMGTILCDAATKSKAKNKARYEPIEEVQIKGFEESIVIYSVTPIQNLFSQRTSQKPDSVLPLVGHQAIVDALLQSIQQNKEDSAAFLIDGDTGMGKTRILKEIRARLNQIYGESVLLLNTKADSESMALPLFPWRSIFDQMFHIDREKASSPSHSFQNSTTPLGLALETSIPQYSTALRGFLAASLEMEMDRMPCGIESRHHSFSNPGGDTNRTSLVEQMLQLPESSQTMPSTSFVSSAPSHNRRSSIGWMVSRRQMVLEHFVLICHHFIRLHGPIIIFLEDVHYFDSLSSEFLTKLMDSIKKGLWIVATRCPDETASNRFSNCSSAFKVRRFVPSEL